MRSLRRLMLAFGVSLLGLAIGVSFPPVAASPDCDDPCETFIAYCGPHYDFPSTIDDHEWHGGRHFIRFEHPWNGRMHRFLVRCDPGDP